jgi:hypothetical protein
MTPDRAFGVCRLAPLATVTAVPKRTKATAGSGRC